MSTNSSTAASRSLRPAFGGKQLDLLDEDIDEMAHGTVPSRQTMELMKGSEYQDQGLPSKFDGKYTLKIKLPCDVSFQYEKYSCNDKNLVNQSSGARDKLHVIAMKDNLILNLFIPKDRHLKIGRISIQRLDDMTRESCNRSKTRCLSDIFLSGA